VLLYHPTKIEGWNSLGVCGRGVWVSTKCVIFFLSEKCIHSFFLNDKCIHAYTHSTHARTHTHTHARARARTHTHTHYQYRCKNTDTYTNTHLSSLPPRPPPFINTTGSFSRGLENIHAPAATLDTLQVVVVVVVVE
jgi:hypothetical protein